MAKTHRNNTQMLNPSHHCGSANQKHYERPPPTHEDGYYQRTAHDNNDQCWHKCRETGAMGTDGRMNKQDGSTHVMEYY
jgi:hypothetical protein